MFAWRRVRGLQVPEQMDDPRVNDAALRRALRFIRRINTWLGYTRATVRHFKRLTSHISASEAITVLDVATGSADVPAALLGRANKDNRPVRVVGLDWHPGTLAVAAEIAQADLSLVRGNALTLPFADGAFDVALTSMFLHHLSDEDVVTALSELRRVARRGVIVADLLRRRRAAAWIGLFTLFSEPMIRHDACVSVRQAFTREEILALARRAGWHDATYHAHVGHRFVLTISIDSTATSATR